MKANIGDVLICDVDQENPYHGSLMGSARVEALTAFKQDQLDPKLAAWFAPCGGGARRITASEVNWETSRIGRS